MPSCRKAWLALPLTCIASALAWADAPAATTPRQTLADTVLRDRQRPYDAAGRKRVHACGVEWGRLKAQGATGPLTWRLFAADCLNR